MQPTAAITEVGFGREGAAQHPFFTAAYRIVKDERGVRVEGGSPDGRCAGTCDRCGISILNIFVFRNRAGDSYMHVGIDCAAKMGIPAEELRKARGHWSGVAREARAAEGRASHAEREAARKVLRAAREVANESLLVELRSLQADPNASDYEREAVGQMVAYVLASDEGGEWMEPGSPGYDARGSEDMRDRLEAIRDRLALCATSRPVVAGKKGLSVKLRAYRNPVTLPGGPYATRYVCFLTDDAGNAFVYKGTRSFGLGRVIEATWSTEGSDERDGLTSTVLMRPRKEKVEPEGPTMAQQVVAGSLGLAAEAVVPDELYECDRQNAVRFTAGGMEYGLTDAHLGPDSTRGGMSWSADYGWHEAPAQGNAGVHGWVILCRKPEDRPDHERR